MGWAFSFVNSATGGRGLTLVVLVQDDLSDGFFIVYDVLAVFIIHCVYLAVASGRLLRFLCTIVLRF